MLRFTDSVTLVETLDAAQKVVAQIGEEQLRSGLEVSAGTISANLDSYYYSRNPVEAHAVIISDVSKIFDSIRPDNYRHLNQTKMRGRPATDTVTLRGFIGNVTIVLGYLVAHEHGFYVGDTKSGKPRWRCGSCRELITITESRKLGLLPPLNRNKT